MKYLSEDLYDYTPSNPWIIEIFKDISKDYSKQFYRNKWFEFYPKKYGLEFTIDEAGYFDERPVVHFHISQLLVIPLIPILIFNFSWWLLGLTLLVGLFGVGKLYLHLPFHTGIENCGESRQWGYYWYGHEGFESGNLVLKLGNKSKYIKMPWNLEWYRTSYVSEWGPDHPIIWISEYKGYHRELWNSSKHTHWSETHPYTYILESGEVQERQATIKVTEREWRRRWLMWTPFLNLVRTSIKIEFDEEVGEESGSWKGGCVGCSYELKPNESPYQCLKRMEQERKF